MNSISIHNVEDIDIEHIKQENYDVIRIVITSDSGKTEVLVFGENGVVLPEFVELHKVEDIKEEKAEATSKDTLKEWALSKGYYFEIVIKLSGVHLKLWHDTSITSLFKSFKEDTEHEAVDKACQWILDNEQTKEHKHLQAVRSAINEVMSVYNKKPVTVRPTDVLKDLDVDSLDLVEIVMYLEEHFDILISDELTDNLKTVQDILDCLDNLDV